MADLRAYRQLEDWVRDLGMVEASIVRFQTINHSLNFIELLFVILMGLQIALKVIERIERGGEKGKEENFCLGNAWSKKLKNSIIVVLCVDMPIFDEKKRE